MNKYVKRENALNMFNRYYEMAKHYHDSTLMNMALDMKQAFLELPTEDVRHVVRCRDCVNVKVTDCGSVCLANDEGVVDNDTCPFGDDGKDND